MRALIFQVDAFTTRRFKGNPAAVMLLESFLPDAVLQAIAAGNNLAHTAFIVPDASDYRLQRFTPTTEVTLGIGAPDLNIEFRHHRRPGSDFVQPYDRERTLAV